MSNRKRAASIVFTGATVTGAVTALAAAPAFATASTWTVTNGGHYTALNNTGQDVFTDTTPASSPTITCPVSDVKGAGSVPNVVSKPNGNSIGTITEYSLGFTGGHSCNGPFGLTFAWTGKSFPWHLNASTSSPSTGVVHGTITGIHLHGGGLGIVSCDFSMTGTAHDTYTNATGVLSISRASLHVTNVTGCGGLINSSDNATISGPITVTNGAGSHPQIHHNTS